MDKRGLHSPGLPPKKTNKPIIQQLGSPRALILTLPVSNQSIYQQQDSAPFPNSSSAVPNRCGYQCICHRGMQTRPTQGTRKLQNPQCNSGTVFRHSDAWKLKCLTCYRKKVHLKIKRALQLWACQFLCLVFVKCHFDPTSKTLSSLKRDYVTYERRNNASFFMQMKSWIHKQ